MPTDPNVDDVIIKVIMPQLYQLIVDLLKTQEAPKHLKIQARKLLPNKYSSAIWPNNAI